MGFYRHKLIYLLLLSMVAPIAMAAQWVHEESLMISEAYTDNVRLSEDNPESRWATIISPNFTLSGKGRRLQVSAAGALQVVTNSDQTFYPILRAHAGAELVEHHFFVDANASASQITINPLSPAGSTIHATNNLTTNYYVNINPYYITALDGWAKLRVDYNLDRNFFVGSEIGDYTRHDFRFSLNDGVIFGPLGWGVSGEVSKTFYDEDTGRDTTFKNLNIHLQHVFERTLTGYLNFGREWNQYTDTLTRKGGPIWQVGMIWRPNPRFTLDAAYGYRFFGHHPTVTLSYYHRHSTLRVNYHEDLESGYYNTGLSRILPDADLAGHPQDPFGEGRIENGLQPRIADAALQGANVNRVFQVDYLLTGRRSRLALTGRYSLRTWEVQPDELLEVDAGATFSRRLARNLSAELGLHWTRVEDETNARADTWDFRFGVNKKLGQFTNLRLSYSFAQRDSNQPDDDYRENRVALVLNTSLRKLLRQAGIRP